MFKRTNISLDTNKMHQAKKISGLKTAKETIDYALSRLIASAQAGKELLKLRGKITFEKNYNYKALR